MKIVNLICCFCLLLMGIVAISQPTPVLAQGENNEEELQITTKYPKIEVTSGGSAEFEVELKLTSESGSEPRLFDLTATGPKDWLVYITAAYPKDKRIASVRVSPGLGVGEKIIVNAAPSYWLLPEPGEYPIILEATSGELTSTYELTVVVTAKYTLNLTSPTGLYNTSVTAGKDNYFSIDIENNSSATVDNITLSSSKPEEWAVDFSLDKVDSLAAGDYQTIDVNIKPPPKAIAGDYLLTLKASGSQASASDISIRVTVKTPTVWGWVGVIIVVAVIAGLLVTFRRFSRR